LDLICSMYFVFPREKAGRSFTPGIALSCHKEVTVLAKAETLLPVIWKEVPTMNRGPQPQIRAGR
jgi:hypothetical protein